MRLWVRQGAADAHEAAAADSLIPEQQQHPEKRHLPPAASCMFGFSLAHHPLFQGWYVPLDLQRARMSAGQAAAAFTSRDTVVECN